MEFGPIIAPKEGYQAAPNPISEEVCRPIGSIIAKRNAGAPGKLDQFTLRLSKKRPHQGQTRIKWGRRAPFHSGQAFRASSPEKAQEEEFNLVVSVVGQRDLKRPEFTGGSRKEFMTQRSRGHLDGHIFGAGELLYVTPRRFE